MKRPPPWTDEARVRDYVRAELEIGEAEEEAEFYLRFTDRPETVPRMRLAPPPTDEDMFAGMGPAKAANRGRGRPPLTPDERRTANPVHDAADQAKIIEAILRAGWPDQGVRKVARRAAKIAGELAGMGGAYPDPAKTIADYNRHLNRRMRRKKPPR
jgi:hypothetical protein